MKEKLYLCHGVMQHSQAEIPRFYDDISLSSVRAGYGKHLCVSGWKSAQPHSSPPAVDERRPSCLFVLESVMLAKAGDIHPAVVLTSRPSVSVHGGID